MTDDEASRHNFFMGFAFRLSIGLLCTLALHAEQSSPALSLLRQGQSFLEAGRYDAAAGRFEEAYNWQPGFEAAFKAGFCFFHLKKFSEAELWLSKARLINPEDEQTIIYLASAQIGNRKPQQAISLLQEFVKSRPDAMHASAMLAAVRSDINPQIHPSRSISQFSLLMLTLIALSAV